MTEPCAASPSGAGPAFGDAVPVAGDAAVDALGPGPLVIERIETIALRAPRVSSR